MLPYPPASAADLVAYCYGDRRTSSGSLAKFAAIRLASSRVSSLAAFEEIVWASA